MEEMFVVACALSPGCLPLSLGAVLAPAHLIDGAEPELVGPGGREAAHRYPGDGGIHLGEVDLPRRV